MQREKNITWISNLRVLAIIAIIVVHVSMEARHKNALYADMIYGGLARFGVPVFLMISGALLLPRETPLAVFSKKWPVKLLPPFLSWSIAYIIHNLREKMRSGDVFTMGQAFDEGWRSIINGSSSFHFWYVYIIVGIYLFIPIISKCARNSTEKELLYFLAIWFVVCCLRLPGLAALEIAFEFDYFAGYLGFLILGYYLSVATFNYSIVSAALIMLAGYGATAGLTYFLTRSHNAFEHAYYNYLGPNVIIMSAGVFLMVKKMNFGLFSGGLLQKVRDIIAQHSYGIYLVHWLVIMQLNDKLNIGFQTITPLIGIPVTTACCLVISLACVWAVNKIPVVGKYISG